MSEANEFSKDFDTLPALEEVSQQRERARKQPTIASVRVSPGPYLTVAAVLTFFAALLLRIQHDGWALLLVSAAWLILPLLAFTDRIVFDGLSLRRQGPISSLLHLLTGYRKQLWIDDFETLETHAVRT